MSASSLSRSLSHTQRHIRTHTRTLTHPARAERAHAEAAHRSPSQTQLKKSQGEDWTQFSPTDNFSIKIKSEAVAAVLSLSSNLFKQCSFFIHLQPPKETPSDNFVPTSFFVFKIIFCDIELNIEQSTWLPSRRQDFKKLSFC